MAQFMVLAGARTGRSLTSYAELHRWSVEDSAAFWSLIEDAWGDADDEVAQERAALVKRARGDDEEAIETLQGASKPWSTH